MKGRFIAIIATAVAALGLSAGILSSSAAAATSGISTVVFDGATNAAWTNDPITEVTGATAYDTATVTGDGTLTPAGSVTYTFFDNDSCTSDANTTSDTEPVIGGLAQDSGTRGPLAAGSYSFQAVYNGDLGVGGDNDPSGPSDCEPFTVSQATPTVPTITNIPSDAIWSSGGGFTATLGSTDSDGTQSVTSSTPDVCTASDLAVTYVTAGTCTLTAQTAESTDYAAASGSPQTFTIGQVTPSGPTVTDLPSDATWSPGGGFTATLGNTDSDGTQSVTSSTTDVCTASGLAVTYVTAGTCTLTAQTAASTDYAGASGSPQTFTIGQATPTAPTITNVPSNATWSSEGGFTAQLSDNGSDGVQLVISSTPDVCSASDLTVTYVTAGTCTLTAQTAESTDYTAVSGSPQTFTIGQVTPTAPTITNVPSNATWSSGGGFTAQLSDNGSDGVQLVISSTPDVCTAGDLAVTYVTAGTCTLTAQTAQSTDYTAVSGSPQTFTIGQVTPTAPTISNLPNSGAYLGGFTASVSTSGDGTKSVTTNAPTVCTVGSDGLTVAYVSVGVCSLTAHVTIGTDYLAADGSAETFTVFPGAASAPSITNLPTGSSYGGGFVPKISTDGDGAKTVTSNSTGVCTVGSDGTVSFVGIGTCSLTSHVAPGGNLAGADGNPQTFNVARATPSSPVVSGIPGGATEFQSFVGAVSTSGDGPRSISSSTVGVCTVGSDGLTVTFVGFGTCTLTATVDQGAHYLGRTGAPQTLIVGPAARGYWLVGSDGGIFSFGAAGFHGSMGGIPLQRPVVGITPTVSRNGYWLVASDGGIFAFGDAAYYGSIPGVGLHPAGSGQPDSLDAPIVGMVPSSTGHGYFMVASDGGVFAFGDARFAGSCPGIGGCDGAAVAVMPDSTGNGYWLVTNLGAVYAFGDADNYGEAPPQSSAVVDAVATPDRHGYWVLYANGAVFGFGDAEGMGAPVGYVNSFNPAAAIFPTADGKGYWVAAARGDVFSYGDALFMGSMAATGLNGGIIAGFGF